MLNETQPASVRTAVETALRRLGIEDVEILPVHDLQLDLGIDSTEVIELAALCGDELGIRTEKVDLKVLRTVADLISQLEVMLGPQATTSQPPKA